MVNPKFLLICAFIGFGLSFFSGIIGGVSFGVILLRSLFFGFCSAGLGFGLRFAAVKFLLDGTEQTPEETAPAQQNHVGTKVDITLDDAELREDNAMLAFSFKPLAQDLKSPQAQNGGTSSESFLERTQPDSTEQAEDDALPPHNITSAETKPVTHGESASLNSDALPEIGDFLTEAPKTDTVPESNSSSGFDAVEATSSVSTRTVDFGNAPDASELAKAIRTVLAKDK